MPKVNEARGEVGVTVGGHELTLCVTMGGLSSLSTELGARTLGELLQRILGVEPVAARAALRHFTVKGDGDAASRAMTIRELADLTDPLATAINAHMGDEPGNGEAAKESA